MPLHLQYRPKNLDEIIGNKNIVVSLKSVLSRGSDIPHAFLFSGGTGLGKTTMARIIAKHLNCDPLDVHEIDAGSERGVETADKVVEGMMYKPMRGENKIYIIDEIQNTSKKFNDCLLKSLEDTPRHVYFVLCTTDPQKISKTIRSRCSEYVLSTLSIDQLVELINRVLKFEGCDDFTEEQIELIATMAEGCPRQVLVILDQVIDVESSERLKIIKRTKIEEKQIIDLCRELLNSNVTWSSIVDTLKILKTNEVDPEAIRRTIISYMDKVLLGKDNPKAFLINNILLNNNFYVNPRASLHLSLYEILH